MLSGDLDMQVWSQEITTGNVSLGLLDIKSAFETKELDESGKCDRENI